jgi:broad specificity phosphatase PhoE
MGQLLLVRHGQASLGAANYDQLSPLGQRQSERLGAHWRSLDLHFDAVLCGSLQRHAQTLAGICEGLQTLLTPLVWEGLNEYDAEAVIDAIHPAPRPKPNTPEAYRQHFRLLRDGLRQWMAGVVSPRGMGTWDAFVQGVTSALDHVRQHSDGRVLVVSSGGPIATAIGHTLGLSPEACIELNLRMRNTSVSEFSFNRKRHRVVSFNTLPHLAEPPFSDWQTYA